MNTDTSSTKAYFLAWAALMTLLGFTFGWRK